MTEARLYKTVTMQVYENGQFRKICDPVVCEDALTIIIDGIKMSTGPCSPGATIELGVGYLLNKGIIQTYSDIKSIKLLDDGSLSITSSGKPFTIMSNEDKDKMEVRSSKAVKTFPEDFDASSLLDMIHQLDKEASTFKKTGGVHSAALGDDGKLLVRYEDIGRHNAVDKVFGYALLNNIPVFDKCLVLSGRISSEILMKAITNSIPLILSRSAPTVKAIQMAEEKGVTIVGFARGKRFNVYSHCERIKL